MLPRLRPLTGADGTHPRCVSENQKQVRPRCRLRADWRAWQPLRTPASRPRGPTRCPDAALRTARAPPIGRRSAPERRPGAAYLSHRAEQGASVATVRMARSRRRLPAPRAWSGGRTRRPSLNRRRGWCSRVRCASVSPTSTASPATPSDGGTHLPRPPAEPIVRIGGTPMLGCMPATLRDPRKPTPAPRRAQGTIEGYAIWRPN